MNRILSELPPRFVFIRRFSLVAAISGALLLGVVGATAVVPNYDPIPDITEAVLEQLGTPKTEVVTPHEGLPYVFDERILSGDNIQTIFRRLGIQDAEALSFLTTDAEGKEALRKLRAGHSVSAVLSSDGAIVSLALPLTGGQDRFIIERGENGLQKVDQSDNELDVLVEMRTGTIVHSLFGATDAAGLPDSVASKFAEIFGTQIDFTRDLREGDQFSVVYETIFHRGVPIKLGRILAAEFVNQGKTHTVVLFKEDDGNEAYYTPDGRGLNQAFLRYPLEFTRISSSFGRRLHPIHKSWRSHNGTDFAAPSGTPIKASSDGKIKFVGTQKGYGNTIIVEHKGRYSTLYAHMRGFAKGLSKGQKIRQGDIIGYVGMTGWATGPHLHYEIRVDNVPNDPMKIALPMVQPLDKKALIAFQQKTVPMLERLAVLNYVPLDEAGAKIAENTNGK